MKFQWCVWCWALSSYVYSTQFSLLFLGTSTKSFTLDSLLYKGIHFVINIFTNFILLVCPTYIWYYLYKITLTFLNIILFLLKQIRFFFLISFIFHHLSFPPYHTKLPPSWLKIIYGNNSFTVICTCLFRFVCSYLFEQVIN